MRKIIVNISNFDSFDYIRGSVFYLENEKVTRKDFVAEKQTQINLRKIIDNPITGDVLVVVWNDDKDIKETHDYLGAYLFKAEDNKDIENISIELKPKSYIWLEPQDTEVKIGEVIFKPKLEGIDLSSFYGEPVFRQKEYKIYKLTDDGVIPFKYFALDKTSETFKVKIEFKDKSSIVKKITIKTIDEPSKDEIQIKLLELTKSIPFKIVPASYAVKKPTLKLNVITTLKHINKIEFFINNQLVLSSDKLSYIYDIDISSLEPFKEYQIKAVLTDENNKKITDINRFFVYEKINALLLINHLQDNKYSIAIDISDEDKNKLQNILWHIKFINYISQEILDIEGEEISLTTTTLFEKKTEDMELEVEFKLSTTYIIEALLILKGGAIQKLTKTLKVKSSDSASYHVGDTVEINIKYPDSPKVASLYILDKNGLRKIKDITGKEIYDNIYNYSFEIKEDNCNYLFKIENTLKSFPIGKGNHYIAVYSPSLNENSSIDFIFKDNAGNIIKTGKLTYGVDHIMYVLLPEDKDGILQIGNKYKKISL